MLCAFSDFRTAAAALAAQLFRGHAALDLFPESNDLLACAPASFHFGTSNWESENLDLSVAHPALAGGNYLRAPTGRRRLLLDVGPDLSGSTGSSQTASRHRGSQKNCPTLLMFLRINVPNPPIPFRRSAL